MKNTCAICGCKVHRTKNTYALPTPAGRSHASKHHYIPERFLGRSNNRKGTQRSKIFEENYWAAKGETEVFCYDCHEELLHNPILLPEDIAALASLVKERNLHETIKTESKEMLDGRIELLH
jgi:hypothetical protein